MKKLSCVFALVVLAVGGKSENYQGYKAYKVTPLTSEHGEFLHQLDRDSHFDFLRHSRLLGDAADVLVSPEVQSYFEEVLQNYTSTGLTFQVTVEDVQQALEQDEPVKATPRANSLFTRFVSHAEMNAYIRNLKQQYPHIVSTESIGKSYEGRELLLIKIGSGNPRNPTIFIDAGIHAREWIAPPAALYIINQLVENPDNARLYQNVNWNIIPSLNPDGYEFSRSSTANRLWRKTRQPNPRTTCIGTDPNRNFDYYWMFAGASSSPCADTYAGASPFSEPETAAVSRYIAAHSQEIKLYISFHSYGNMILYPWGYTATYPANAFELQSLGDAAAEAIGSASTIRSRYVVGSSTNVIYEAAGGSDDWVKGVAKVQLAYTIELPAGGLFGFNPAASSILPMVRETFEGIRVFQKYIENKFSKV